MIRVAPAGMPVVATRTAAAAAPAAVRSAVDPRAVRGVVQARCLLAVIGAPSASLSRLQGLVLAPALAAVAVYLVLGTTRSPGHATLGTLRARLHPGDAAAADAAQTGRRGQHGLTHDSGVTPG